MLVAARAGRTPEERVERFTHQPAIGTRCRFSASMARDHLSFSLLLGDEGNPPNLGTELTDGHRHQIDPVGGWSQSRRIVAHRVRLEVGELTESVVFGSSSHDRLDLDGDRSTIDLGVQIDLAATESNVPPDNPRPALLEEPGRQALAETTDALPMDIPGRHRGTTSGVKSPEFVCGTVQGHQLPRFES